MKKFIIGIVLSLTLLLGGCGNYNYFDTSWEFNYAYIICPNGKTIEVEIVSWTEDENSITIQATDGQVYSIGYQNCYLTKNKMDWY